ncbi:MAG: hypothetical protein V1867_06635 [Candidatus Falkowbacteria bacterium]
MNLQELIKNITPYYNDYRKRKDAIKGYEGIELYWEVGDLIAKYLSENLVAPDALYRQIYGKSERQGNVSQKSYITRDFLSRAYRIRNIFESKGVIKNMFPKLLRFRQFYQAMPFFDNEKYILQGQEKEKLLIVLNSQKSNKEIMAYVHRMQKEKIGIKNPRTQRLKELDYEKKVFIDFYNLLYNKIKNRTYKDAVVEIGTINQDFVSKLSKNTGALASDQLQIQVFEVPGDVAGLWREYAEMVNRLVAKKDAIERRRFRRLIPPEKMMRLSEMIYAIRSEEDFKKFRL